MKFTGEYLRELAEKREKLVNDARGFYETMTEAEAGSDAASQAKESYKKLRVDLDQADAEFRQATAWVADQQELRDLEARNREFQSAIDKGVALAGGENRATPEDVDPDAPIPTATGSADPAEDQAFRNAYFAKLRNYAQRAAAEVGIEIRNPTPFTEEHRNALKNYEKRVIVSTAAAGTDVGSNAIPETFTGEVIEFMKFSGPMVPGGGLCREFNTDTGVEYHLTTVDDTAVDGETMTEVNRAKTGTSAGTNFFSTGADPKFNRVTFGAHMYDSQIIPVTYEMIMDTQIDDLESLLGELAGKRLGRKINTDFTAELTTAAKKNKITTAAATSFTSDELMSLPHKIDPSYRGVGRSGSSQNRLQIMFSDATYQVIRLMKTPVTGTIASGLASTPYLTENGRDIMDGDADKLLGRYPIWLNQKMEAVASEKAPIIIGDFANARIRSVQSPFVKWSEEYHWEKHMLAMVALQRCDFKVVNEATFAAMVMKK